MGLHWSIEKVRDHEALTTEEAWTTTNAIVWATMAVGIGDLTEADAPTFYARLHVYERLVGAFRIGADGPIYFTPAEVRRYIGLHTNVARDTDAAWRKRIMAVSLRDAEREYELALADEEVTAR